MEKTITQQILEDLLMKSLYKNKTFVKMSPERKEQLANTLIELIIVDGKRVAQININIAIIPYLTYENLLGGFYCVTSEDRQELKDLKDYILGIGYPHKTSIKDQFLNLSQSMRKVIEQDEDKELYVYIKAYNKSNPKNKIDTPTIFYK